MAIDQINRSGGVNGEPIVTEVADEGDTPVTAARSISQLLASDVDGIVGPASSLVAATTLPVTVSAGVVSCSPSANALALRDFPDGGLFIRTIPSDALQAAAMANQMQGTGYRSVSILYVDDSYGRDFAEVLYEELTSRTIEVAEFVPFDISDDDYLDEAAIAVSSKAIAVIGDDEAGVRMVDAVFEAGGDQTEIVVNDAMRVPSSTEPYSRLSDVDRQHLYGVSPQSGIPDSAFDAEFRARYPDSRGLFAINAYDCVNVLALAANSASSTDGVDIIQQVSAVTTNGTRCINFSTCDTLRANQRDIDYDGPSNLLDLGPDGEPTSSVFDLFGYDERGVDVVQAVISSD